MCEYVFLCGPAYECSHTYITVHVEVVGQSLVSILTFILFETGSLVVCLYVYQASPPHSMQGSPCGHWDCRQVLLCLAFMVLEIWTQVFTLHSNHFSHWTVFPAPKCHFKNKILQCLLNLVSVLKKWKLTTVIENKFCLRILQFQILAYNLKFWNWKVSVLFP